jgi:hypothetical protein
MSANAVNPWPWFAAAVLSLVALADASLVVAARRARPSAVEERPWLASAGFDAAKAARARFAAAGMSFEAAASGGSAVRCTLAPAGATIGRATIVAYRPDDSGLDRRIAWPDSARAITFALPRAGWWRLRLESADGATVADAEVEARP